MVRFLIALLLAGLVYYGCRSSTKTWFQHVEETIAPIIPSSVSTEPTQSIARSEPAVSPQPKPDKAGLRFVPSSNREERSRQLAGCAVPGPLVKRLMNVPGSPLDRLLWSYGQLRDRWQYRRDDIDGAPESFQTAEDSLGPLGYAGDCEDKSVVVMACSESIKVPSRIVMHRGKSHADAGHAYAEVLIADTYAEAQPLLERLARDWALNRLAYRQETDGGVWVAFDFAIPAEHYEEGPLAYFIYPDGRLQAPLANLSDSSDQRLFFGITK